MIVRQVSYSKGFIHQYRKLPSHIQMLTTKKERIFKENPLHPSLRLHQLKGKLAGIWSVSITGNYRMLFERTESGDILFFSIGTHDVYKNL